MLFSSSTPVGRINRFRIGLRYPFVLLLLLSTAVAQAADWNQEYMLVSGRSWHLDAPRHYNENNLGGGYQQLLRDGPRASGWTWNLFQDSYNHASGYIGYAWQYRIIDDKLKVDVGALAFMMTRADVLSSFPFPGVLPYISVGNREYFANITFIPGFDDTKAVLFLHLGMRLDQPRR